MSAAVGTKKGLCLNSPFHFHRCPVRSFLPGGRGDPFLPVAKSVPRGLCRGHTVTHRTINNNSNGCPVVCLATHLLIQQMFSEYLPRTSHSSEFRGNSSTAVENILEPGKQRRRGVSLTARGEAGSRLHRWRSFLHGEEGGVCQRGLGHEGEQGARLCHWPVGSEHGEGASGKWSHPQGCSQGCTESTGSHRGGTVGAAQTRFYKKVCVSLWRGELQTYIEAERRMG